MGCRSGDLSVESRDQVFSNGFERSNVLNLGGNAAGQASSDQLTYPSSLVVLVVMMRLLGGASQNAHELASLRAGVTLG
jgi:hypothetical protein